MNRLVIADSSCDLGSTPGSLQVVPLTISLGTDSFVDDSNLNLGDLLNTMKEYKGKSSTACPSVQAWMSAFLHADEVFVVTMTSVLSGTYNSARVASEMCAQEFPDKKIALFDTLSTGPEMVLLIEQIQKWISEQVSFEEIKTKAEAYMKSTHLLFTLKSLHNLAANGRVSKLIASAFDVLGMRMLAIASPEGTIKPLFQCRGDRRALEKMMDYLKAEGYCGGKVRISHVLNAEGAEKLKAHIIGMWPTADVKVYPTTGLCSYYAEQGGLLVGFETNLH